MILLLLISAVLGYATYNLKTEQTNYGYKGVFTKGDGAGPFPPDAETLDLQIYLETPKRLHIKIVDPKGDNYVIPEGIESPEVTVKAKDPEYSVYFPEKGGIIVRRNSINETLLDTSAGQDHYPLAYERYFMQLCSTVNKSPLVYGLGERRTRFALSYPFNYSNFNMDRGGTPNDGTPLYGTHPFHIEVLPSGNAHGILFYNAAPSQVELEDGFITWRSITGGLDLYIFLGPTQIDIMDQYTELVGRPQLVPRWAMGFHQCHWGYNNIDALKEIVANYEKNNIPLDVLWNDIDFMNGFRLFTTEPNNYPQPAYNEFIDSIRNEKHIRMVVILDPGVKVDPDNYQPYTDLLESGLFMRNSSGLPFIGSVWPGSTLFPSFDNPESFKFWGKWVMDFVNNIVKVDGLWLDMNELSNFCDGECDGTGVNDNITFPWGPLDGMYDLNSRSVPITAQLNTISFLKVRNAYGHFEEIRTRKALKDRQGAVTQQQRQFMLARSTFVGSGRNTAIWLGDNYATFEDLTDSISGILTSGLFGVTFVGCDLGGSGGPTWGELHVRWVEAAAFMYPFFRDHSGPNLPHTLYSWGDPYTGIMRTYVNQRQRIHSYHYTLNMIAHYKGTPLLRSLFMEFPTDFNTSKIDTQAMVGSALLVSPVLKNASTVVENAYFPKARWYDFWTLAEDARVSNGTQKPINIEGVALDQVLVHIRGGTIHTQQQHFARVTVDMAGFPLTVVAACDEKGAATGEVIVDDGITDDDPRYSPVVNQILRVNFTLASQVLKSTVAGDFKTDQKIERFQILGVPAAFTSVTVEPNNVPFKAEYDTNAKAIIVTFDGAGPENENKGFPLSTPITITWK